ncbi:hypothetical protein Taro_007371, partial [Colocasia esculenta]|nr:hypothetical protein [Colocasia esculenta]
MSRRDRPSRPLTRPTWHGPRGNHGGTVRCVLNAADQPTATPLISRRVRPPRYQRAGPTQKRGFSLFPRKQQKGAGPPEEQINIPRRRLKSAHTTLSSSPGHLPHVQPSLVGNAHWAPAGGPPPPPWASGGGAGHASALGAGGLATRQRTWGALASAAAATQLCRLSRRQRLPPPHLPPHCLCRLPLALLTPSPYKYLGGGKGKEHRSTPSASMACMCACKCVRS